MRIPLSHFLCISMLPMIHGVLASKAENRGTEDGKSITCGQVVTKTKNRIVGGEDASRGAWPWQISLQYKGKHACGGTLISADWVLTAAHCFPSNVRFSDYQVNLGNYQLLNPEKNAQWVKLSKVFAHKAYAGDGTSGDIALAQLERPVHFTESILPACLPDARVKFSNGTFCWVTGWGAPSYGASLGGPMTLQQIRLPLIDTMKCDEMYHIGTSINPNTREIQDDMICAGYETGKKDACVGDSGGPLVCQDNGAYYVAGIVSWGDMCALPNRPGVYTLVSFYEDWIKKHYPRAQFGLVNITYNKVRPSNSASSLFHTDFSFFLLLTAMSFIGILLK
nr:serine protease 27-like [Anolis sagrei ordinatus]